MSSLNLRNHKITLGEILDEPRARALLMKKFPLVFKKQFNPVSKTVTLEQLLALIGGFLPQKLLHDTIRELEQL